MCDVNDGTATTATSPTLLRQGEFTSVDLLASGEHARGGTSTMGGE
jgi:hypothetical protein